MKTSEIVSCAGVESVSKFLETSPRDELFSAEELSSKFGIPPSTIRHSYTLRANAVKYDGKRYWGSMAAIKEFLRQTNEN